MLTFKKAVFDGIASSTLVRRWKYVTEESIILDQESLLREFWFDRRFSVICILTAIAALVVNKFAAQQNGAGVVTAVLTAISLVSFVLLLCGFAWGTTRKFVADCKELSKYIDNPGCRDDRGLLFAAEMKLVSIATEIIFIEIPMSFEHPVDTTSGEATNEHRARFKTAFETMKKFGLTGETWDPYFNKAKARAESYKQGKGLG